MATPPPQHGAGPYPPYPAQQGGPYAVPQQGGGPYVAQQPAPYGPYGGPLAAPPGAYACRLCGAQPAAPVTVRGHQGMLVLMRFLSRPGPFCRDCGLATYRQMTGDTLWQGWWGPLSFFITPVTVLTNLGARASFRRLAPPVGGFRPPLPPGKSLWRHPAVLLLAVPIVLFVLAVLTLIVIGVVAGDDTPRPLSSGQCVRNEGDWSHQKLIVTDCLSVRAQYRVTRPSAAPGGTCAPGDFLARPEYSVDGTLNCLTPLH
ncbi:hypothetical protein ABZ128_27075 [Streptomyces sp. NPDC006326]|uniref:LppU/SCO3897 family protein n=1 Tax=Streptomyces sp. NPDC006326 TaxID=3156752 RepID=UPI0033B5498B